MSDNIDRSLRALCHAQENRIKVQQRSLSQLQIAVASIGTLAAQYKAALDSCIKALENMVDEDSVYQSTVDHAKKVSETNGAGPADAIMRLLEENHRLKNAIVGFQTNQDQLEAKVISQRNEIAKLERFRSEEQRDI